MHRCCGEFRGIKIKRTPIAPIYMLVAMNYSSNSSQSECLNEKNTITYHPQANSPMVFINHGQYGPPWIGPCLPLYSGILTHSIPIITLIFYLLHQPTMLLYYRHLLFPLSGNLFPTFPNGLISHYIHLSSKLSPQGEFPCDLIKLAISPPSLSSLFPSLVFFTALVTTWNYIICLLFSVSSLL